MTGRFAAPELLALGRPPALAFQPYETLFDASRVRLVAGFQSAGIPYDVQGLQTSPPMILAQEAAYRDLLRRQAIDDAVAQTYLGSASGAFLDQRAADYGVLRRSLAHSGDGTPGVDRPDTVPPAWSWDATAALWREDDDSLRSRARLAWEALSVAGPAGAYAFHAADAHPAVYADGTNVIGPETGLVDPGEVLVVVQSFLGTGVPTIGVLDAIAARLDAAEVIDAAAASTLLPVRQRQSVRPLGARVTVQACQPLTFNITATLHLLAGPDPEAIRLAAVARLNAYLASRRRVGVEVPRSGIIAALHLTGTDGLPVCDEVTLTVPSADVVPSHIELATIGTIAVTTALR
jgi:phage-related baseplate assembly protein